MDLVGAEGGGGPQVWQQTLSGKHFWAVGQVPLALLQHPQPVDVQCRTHLLPPVHQLSEQLVGEGKGMAELLPPRQSPIPAPS